MELVGLTEKVSRLEACLKIRQPGWLSSPFHRHCSTCPSLRRSQVGMALARLVPGFESGELGTHDRVLSQFS